MAAFVLTVRKHGKTCKVMAKGSVTPVLALADTVEWRNRTGDRVVVFFPHANVFGTTLLKDVADGSSSGAFPVTLVVGAGNSKTFRYGIWCDQTDDWAVGNSDPEIIVEA
jgi:hypothetical protein